MIPDKLSTFVLVSTLYTTTQNQFIAHFRVEPLLVRSPGRINLIGEHTDYNNGFVMPAAIDKEIVFAVAPSNHTKSKIFSLHYNEMLEVDLGEPQQVKAPAWANYLLGVARQFINNGVALKPINCVFDGNIPNGAGLSSSAAVEGGFAFALNKINEQKFSPIALSKMGQWAEHNFVGVKCGIMDQFANMLGKEDQIVLLDCQSLDYHYIPLQLKEYTIVLINSGVKHSLASSEYNVRRQECEEGVRILIQEGYQVASLRDVTLSMLKECKDKIPKLVYNRCQYVVEENERVQQASVFLQHHNLKAFGRKLWESHAGLSKLYEVSCEETDYLVSLVQDHEEVLGARMMGGGFGGCTINIIHQDAVARILDNVNNQYRKRFGIKPESYFVKIKDGTSLVS